MTKKHKHNEEMAEENKTVESSETQTSHAKEYVPM